MPKNSLPIRYSQNFLRPDFHLQELIRTKTKIDQNDLVLDIGAGRGVLTKALAREAKQVVAFEMDPRLAASLQEELNFANVNLVALDFLQADLKRYAAYKVFANIPFFLSAAIVRKLFLETDNPPKEAHLFLQQETAARFCGRPQTTDTLMSYLIKSFWELKISYYFKPADFVPEPGVEVVLLSFLPRTSPLIPYRQRGKYFDLVCYVINERKPRLKNALLKLFTFPQLKFISAELHLNLDLPVRDLTLQDWQGLYQKFNKLVEPRKQMQIMGSYAKLMRHQDKLNRNKEITVPRITGSGSFADSY